MVIQDVTVEVFWKAFEALKPAQRRTLAERILRDRRLLEDLGDHLLIERAKRVRGKAITLDEYTAHRGTANR